MEQQKQKKESFIKEIVKFTLIAIAIVLPIRTYIAQPFIVSGASMDPTFTSGQYLIVDQLTYHFHDPERGDVVIFKFPRNTSTYFIKRIIGLPGETLIVNQGEITIINSENPKGFILDDTYRTTHPSFETFKVTLGESEYFVMGDNRPQSSDSRLWGPLEKKYIIGRPFVRLTPLSKISVFPGQ
jgi:signal peptidase I